ncbi:hypothetical protein BT69DRAFT_1359262, partial [Atractiella rhizophila]
MKNEKIRCKLYEGTKEALEKSFNTQEEAPDEPLGAECAVTGKSATTSPTLTDLSPFECLPDELVEMVFEQLAYTSGLRDRGLLHPYLFLSRRLYRIVLPLLYRYPIFIRDRNLALLEVWLPRFSNISPELRCAIRELTIEVDLGLKYLTPVYLAIL